MYVRECVRPACSASLAPTLSKWQRSRCLLRAADAEEAMACDSVTPVYMTLYYIICLLIYNVILYNMMSYKLDIFVIQ